MTTKLLSVIVGSTLLASACATPSGTGTAVGAGGGALVGGALGGTSGALIGGALGGILGYGVGRDVEIENQRRMEQALAMQSQQPVTWQSPQTGSVYTLSPEPIYMTRGQPCREFTMLAQTQNGPTEVTGTACQTNNGTWQVVAQR